MKDQEILQSWQPFFMTFGGAMAALAGLVFVAMSLKPQPILGHPLMRARAFVAGTGFLMGVVWALIMLMPARLAPSGSFLLIAEGIGGEQVLWLPTDPSPQGRSERCASCPRRYPRAGTSPRRNRGSAAALFRIPFLASCHRGWRGAAAPLFSVMDAGDAQRCRR